jgi:peptide/nickel transport system permease protein
VRRALGSWPGRIGIALTLFVLLVAVVGPSFAPHPPNAIVGIPFARPSAHFPLGIDFAGRDVLSRLLYGGRSVVILAGIATLAAYVIGAAIGLAAGYRRSILDSVSMRFMDILLAFPPILLLLVLATGAGPNPIVLVIGIVLVQVPGIARIIRTATADLTVRGYVEAAVARGESTPVILLKEVLPNLWGIIVADGGPRLTVSVLLVAAINYLGLGLRPPAADWALMISENQGGLTFQPWSVIAPAILIAMLTIGINTFADALARGLGRSVDVGELRR